MLAHNFILQNGGIRTRQIPRLEEGTPIDHCGDFRQIKILEHAPTNEFGFGGDVGSNLGGVSAGFFQAPHGGLLFISVLLSNARVVCMECFQIRSRFFAQKPLCHAHAAGCIRHINHRPIVMRVDFDGGMHAAGGRAANQQRHFAQAEIIVLLHLGGDVLHFFQARRNQAR